MDDVLNGAPAEEQPQVEVRPQEGENQQAEAQGEPTTPENDRHVPLAALEAERKGRQDWKEKAIRYEEELKQYRQQPSQPQRELHPIEAMQQQMVNERFNTSEMLARSAYKDDLDAKVEVFMEAAKQNPALAAALHQQRHPWEFAYQEGARMLLQREIGSDPTAYRKKVEEEIRAKVLAEMGGNQAQVPRQLPSSLAGVRSAASRSSPGFTGPTPFDQILK